MSMHASQARGIATKPPDDRAVIGLRLLEAAFAAFARAVAFSRTEVEQLTLFETLSTAVTDAVNIVGHPLSTYREVHDSCVKTLVVIWGSNIHRLFLMWDACPPREFLGTDEMCLVLRIGRIHRSARKLISWDVALGFNQLVYVMGRALEWILIWDRAMTTNRLEIAPGMLDMKQEAIDLLFVLLETLTSADVEETNLPQLLTCFAADLFVRAQFCLRARRVGDAIPAWYRAVHRCWPHASVATAMLQVSIFTVGAELTESIGAEADLRALAQVARSSGASQNAKDDGAFAAAAIDNVKDVVARWMTVHRATEAFKDPDP